jgi:hypothetical protein
MVFLAAAFIGIGLSIRRLFHLRSIDLDRCLSAFWVGFAVTVGFLQIWHLFFAIGDYVVWLVGLAGLIGLWLNRNAFLEWAFEIKLERRSSLLGIACVGVVALWVANNAAGAPISFDSGNYHIPVVRWYTTYPVVLGLGNLHDRLAFNPSSLLYDAMLESGPWQGRSVHVANALLVLVFLLQILVSTHRLILERRKPIAPYVFDPMLIAPVIAIVISRDVSSFSTDIPPAIVLFVLCSAVYRLLLVKSDDPAEIAYRVATVVTLAVLAVCLKVSYAVVCPLLAIIAVCSTVFGTNPTLGLRSLKWCGVAVPFLILPWMIHGVLLSGYPVYPSTFGGLPVAWRIPAELATAERLWVLVLARCSTADHLSWLPDWINCHLHPRYFDRVLLLSRGMLGVVIPLIITIASSIGLAVAHFRGRKARTGEERWVAVACAAGAIFWFLTAPAPRFGFAILWSVAAATVAQWAGRYEHTARVLAVPTAFALSLLPLVFPVPERDYFNTMISRVAVLPGPDHGLHPYPRVALYVFTTDSGLALNVPMRNDLCFDSPLPCTPHPASNLSLVHARDGRPEFVTNGRWQQIDWPNNSMEDPLKERFLQYLEVVARRPREENKP